MCPSLPRLPRAAFLLAALLPGIAFAQNPRVTGKINDAYTTNCSNCHGKKLEGGQTPGGNKVPSLLDDEWMHGGDDESIARSIKNGYPQKEMPPWGGAMTDKEIRAMVVYIREQQSLFRRGQVKLEKPADNIAVKSQLHSFQVNTWVEDITEPYSLAFLTADRAIMTEKGGNIFLIENGKRASAPLSGFPAVENKGQAGLYDVVPHPKFAENGWLYFAFADPQKNAAGEAVALTKVIRGKIRDGALVDQQTIFQAPVEVYPKSGGPHFGGRMAFDKAGYLFITIGERGNGQNAQNLAVPMGKVHRVFDDGRVPEDNPFRKDTKAFPTIWTYGHRNPQGLAVHPLSGDMYDIEHGPRGGDEINLVRPGRNYGWPVITYGMDYPGTPIGEGLTAKEGMEQPVKYWVPSIAPCGASFYTGSLFPKLKNQLCVSSLVGEQVVRFDLKGDKVVSEEMLFRDLGRIRHIIGGPDGALYVLLPKRIARITPAP
ncbi:MAG TPA: PQQ-dependent sugar dehydrogenase [Opitutaceae bacterium]|nr:PQQ-dependent sugar dehydrogenase [Opitutaceae bacterium]